MATIYRICPLPVLNCNINDIYVGSTTQTLNQRWASHKCEFKRWQTGLARNCSSYRLFEKYGVDNCTILEIERVCIENRKEREAYWIGFHDGVNERRLTFDKREYQREYYIQNRDDQNKRASEWEKANRETRNQYRREYCARKRAEKLARLADVTPPSEQ